jgi:hypothetical protein
MCFKCCSFLLPALRHGPIKISTIKRRKGQTFCMRMKPVRPGQANEVKEPGTLTRADSIKIKRLKNEKI